MCCSGVVCCHHDGHRNQTALDYLFRRSVRALAISFCMSALAFSALTLDTDLRKRYCQWNHLTRQPHRRSLTMSLVLPK